MLYLVPPYTSVNKEVPVGVAYEHYMKHISPHIALLKDLANLYQDNFPYSTDYNTLKQVKVKTRDCLVLLNLAPAASRGVFQHIVVILSLYVPVTFL